MARLLHFFRAVCAAVGVAANAAAELTAEFFAVRAVKAGIASFALKALRLAVPVEGIAEIEAGVALLVACGVLDLQADGFARSAVIEMRGNVGIDAAALCQIADHFAAVIGLPRLR